MPAPTTTPDFDYDPLEVIGLTSAFHRERHGAELEPLANRLLREQQLVWHPDRGGDPEVSAQLAEVAQQLDVVLADGMRASWLRRRAGFDRAMDERLDRLEALREKTAALDRAFAGFLTAPGPDDVSVAGLRNCTVTVVDYLAVSGEVSRQFGIIDYSGTSEAGEAAADEQDETALERNLRLRHKGERTLEVDGEGLVLDPRTGRPVRLFGIFVGDVSKIVPERVVFVQNARGQRVPMQVPVTQLALADFEPFLARVEPNVPPLCLQPVQPVTWERYEYLVGLACDTPEEPEVIILGELFKVDLPQGAQP